MKWEKKQQREKKRENGEKRVWTWTGEERFIEKREGEGREGGERESASAEWVEGLSPAPSTHMADRKPMQQDIVFFWKTTRLHS